MSDAGATLEARSGRRRLLRRAPRAAASDPAAKQRAGDGPQVEAAAGATVLGVATPGAAIRRLASALGVTEGQAYTLVIGLVVAFATSIIGIPPTLRDRPSAIPAASPSSPVTEAETELDPDSSRPPRTAETPSAALDPGTPPASPSSAASPPAAPPLFGPAPVEDTDPRTARYPDGGSYGAVERAAAVAPPGAPDGIAVASNGGFYVATDNADGRGEPGPSKILRYSPLGLLAEEYVVEGQPDEREHGLKGLVLDGEERIYALDGATARILRFDPEDGAQEVWATLPDVAPCTPVTDGDCEPGPIDQPPVPRAAAFDAGGDLFVTDTGQGIVWKVESSGEREPELWHASADYASPSGSGPAGIQFDSDGHVVLAVTTSLVGLTGAVYLIEVADDGTAGEVEELFRSDPGEAPSGLALGANGAVYVALAGSNELLVLHLGSGGSERLGGSEDVAFDVPASVAFRGRSLLVTNQSSADSGDDWAVLRVPVREQGLPLHRPTFEQ